MEPGAEPGRPGRRLRHRPGHLGGEGVRVGLQSQHGGGGQLRRQQYRPALPTAPSGPRPAAAPGRHPSRPAVPRRRAAAAAYRGPRTPPIPANRACARRTDSAASSRRRSASGSSGAGQGCGTASVTSGLSVTGRLGLGEQPALLPRGAQDRLQVGRGRPRPDQLRPPGVARPDQQPLGPGHRDVGQPVLGQPLLLRQLGLVRAHGGVAGLGQLRDRPGVTAQVGGQHGRVGHPVVGDPVAGEDALHQGGQEHRLPLQALGLVHGQQLDRLAVRRHGLVEAGALLELGLQVAQQPAERGFAVHVDVGGHGVQERAELVAARTTGRTPGWPAARCPARGWRSPGGSGRAPARRRAGAGRPAPRRGGRTAPGPHRSTAPGPGPPGRRAG